MTRFMVIAIALLCTGCDGAAENAVKQQLVDPDSAEFTEVTTEGNVTCGLVNSKNRMGGYTGRQLFIVRDKQVYFWPGSAGVDQAMLGPCSTEAFGVGIRNLRDGMRSRND